MSEGQAEDSKRYDPLESFRGMRDAYLDVMAKAMVETVNTEAYAKANGAVLESSLNMAAPFREALEKSMVQALQQLSLPSRQDIVRLAERFTNMEMRLDDMDAGLERIETDLQKSMLPVLQQLVLISNGLKTLSARVAATERSSPARPSAPVPMKSSARLSPTPVKARGATKVAAKRAPVQRKATKGAKRA